MTDPIFNDQYVPLQIRVQSFHSVYRDDKYRKITAGGNFFTSFADRTEAYNFDHVIGVMHFNTEVDQTLPLCQRWPTFKVSNK